MTLPESLDVHFRRARELARWVVLVGTGSDPQTCALGGATEAYRAAVAPALGAYTAAVAPALDAYKAAVEAEKRAEARARAFQLLARFIPTIPSPNTWISSNKTAEQVNYHTITQYMNRLEYGCGLVDYNEIPES